MKTDTPNKSSGKTYFNRIKKRGESWTELRDTAVRDGSWHQDKKESPDSK